MNPLQHIKVSHKKILFVACVIVIGFGGLLGGSEIWERMTTRVYGEVPSPDGRFTIVIYRKLVLPYIFPGQTGDAPGYVRLIDQQKNVLQEKELEMVQLVSPGSISWKDDVVIIPTMAIWPLPAME